MNNFIASERVETLVHYYNDLHLRYDNLPIGCLSVQLDDGYVGEFYSIEFDCKNGCFVLACGDDNTLYYAVLYKDGTSSHGDILKSGIKEMENIVKLIKKTI